MCRDRGTAGMCSAFGSALLGISSHPLRVFIVFFLVFSGWMSI